MRLGHTRRKWVQLRLIVRPNMAICVKVQVQTALPAIFVFAIALSQSRCCIAAIASSGENSFLRLLDQYTLPRTLHCKVTTWTDYKTIPPGLFHVDGVQEYWTDGPRYRILQLQDSALLRGMSHDVRWDGDRFQWFNVNDATLMFSRRPAQKTPFIGEPLALLPLEFLNPSGNRLAEKLPLQELLSAETRARVSQAKFLNSDNTVAYFPGGKMGDTDFSYRIEFGGAPSYLPTVIRRISASGVELDTDEIRYGAVQCATGVIYLPDWARLIDRTTDNHVDVVSTWTASEIKADVSIPTEIFTLDFQMAKHVLNMDDFSSSKRPATSTASSFGTTSREALPIVVADDSELPLRSIALLIIGAVALLTALALLLLRTPSNRRGQP
jgi:hypothetical protein